MTCLDSNVLIYATEPSDDPRRVDLRRRVVFYFEKLKEAGTPVIIPTFVLYEYLIKYPVEQHPAVRATLEENFVVYNPDIEVASKAAELFRNRQAATAGQGGQVKQTKKLDILIAATALCAKATEILSEDRDYSVLTDGKLKSVKPSTLPLPLATLVDDLPPPDDKLP